MNSQFRLLFRFGLILEILLVFISLVWMWQRETLQSNLGQLPTFGGIVANGFLLFLLIGVAELVLRILRRWPSLSPASTEFFEEILRPFARSLSLPQTLILSLAAGIGEEFFFRGVLEAECGSLITSLLFAFAHFGLQLRRYWMFFIIYTAFSFVFSLALVWGDSLWAPVILHAVYDIAAILRIKMLK